MTRIIIENNDIEFQVIIPAYFRGTNDDLIRRLQRHGYNFSISGDAFAFYAESKHYPNEDQKPQLIISVSTNSVIKDYLGSSVVEEMKEIGLLNNGKKGLAYHLMISQFLMKNQSEKIEND